MQLPSRPAEVDAVSEGRVPASGRILILDGIRGIAVLLVMTFHFWIVAFTGGTRFWERVYDDVAGMGWIGVDLFFVLSGFLITGILYDSRESSRYFRVFYGRRTLRIFPLYYAALTTFFLIGPLVLTHVYRPALAEMQSGTTVRLFAWTYLLNWYEGFKGWGAVAHPLQHFWSLAVEEQFYLIWPFLVLKLARRRLMGVCVGLMVLALTLRAVLYWLHLPVAAYLWTICRADSLAIGGVVALAARDPGDWQILLKWARRLALPALGALIVGRILNPGCTVGPGDTPTFFMNTFELTLAGVFFGACIAIAVGSRKQSLGHRVVASPFLRFFGKYSYCLYICHLPVIVIFAKAGLNSTHLVGRLHSELLSVLAVNGIALAVSIAIAFASWHLYEKQWLKLTNLPGLQRQDPSLAPLQSDTGHPRQGLRCEPLLSPEAGAAAGTGTL
jgi:peptidoglycan/LPS O-acetylase OafA/YrhL